MQAVTSKAERIVFNKAHEAILQTLERVFDKRLYRAEDFANAQDWDDSPAIYAQEHPDLEGYDKDPQAELARINGRVVGSVAKAHIETPGHPRLMALLDIKDAEVEEGIAKGEISLSTGFWAVMAKDNDVAVTAGPVKPHHVLLFREDRNNLPRDLGTGILNKGPGDKDGKDMADEKKEPDMAPFLAEINKSKDELAAKGVELEAMRAEVNKRDEKITALENKLAEIAKAEKDGKWEQLKNSYIPPGLVAKESDEKALRELMDKDPVAFINKVEAVKVDITNKGEVGKGVLGQKRQEKNSQKDDREIGEEMAKLGISQIDFEVK